MTDKHRACFPVSLVGLQLFYILHLSKTLFDQFHLFCCSSLSLCLVPVEQQSNTSRKSDPTKDWKDPARPATLYLHESSESKATVAVFLHRTQVLGRIHLVTFLLSALLVTCSVTETRYTPAICADSTLESFLVSAVRGREVEDEG